jgi:hypothetical protein
LDLLSVSLLNGMSCDEVRVTFWTADAIGHSP